MTLRAVEPLREVKIGDKKDAQAVGVGHLALIDAVTLGKGLVPGSVVLGKCRSAGDGRRAERGEARSGEFQKIPASDVAVVLRRRRRFDCAVLVHVSRLLGKSMRAATAHESFRRRCT